MLLHHRVCQLNATTQRWREGAYPTIWMRSSRVLTAWTLPVFGRSSASSRRKKGSLSAAEGTKGALVCASADVDGAGSDGGRRARASAAARAACIGVRAGEAGTAAGDAAGSEPGRVVMVVSRRGV
jgi:hypothetical protein